MRRNLLFHLYPVRGSFWAWHLEQLRLHWSAFNGRKRIIVAIDRRTAALAAVERALDGLDAELSVVENDPKRGETAGFLERLGDYASTRDDESTFYAHGKGVTYRGLESLIMQSWSEAMYTMNLSDPRLIDSVLSEYSAAGCFQQRIAHGGSRWHYSGTFFWFKHSALFSRRWRRIQDGKYGVEGYLGKHIPAEEAFCLTPFRHFVKLYGHVIARSEPRRWMKELRERCATGTSSAS